MMPKKHLPLTAAMMLLSAPAQAQGATVNQTVNHFEEAKQIWQRFVPSSGQADTVQGELLRAVEKLRNEAIRNGNGNWDDGFKILLAYLMENLLDPAAYDRTSVTKTRAILDRIADFDNPLLDDKPYDALADRVVEYYRYYGSRPHEKNAALLR